MKLLFIILLTINLNAQDFWWWEDDATPEEVYAIDLNGSDEYAQKVSPSDMDLSGKVYTLIAWVKTPDPVAGTTNRTIISSDANTTRGWLFVLGSNEAWTLTYNNGTGAGAATAVETRDGVWTLIVATCYDISGGVSDYAVYIDDNAPNHTFDAGNTVAGADKLTVGMDGYPQGFYYNSQLGQIQVVSGYALTAEEITALYNAGGSLNASYGGGTVVAWYKWRGATDAEMLKDWSASGNDLTGTNLTIADQVLVGTTYTE